MTSYKDSPLRILSSVTLDVAVKSAGAIQNAADWKFADTHIVTKDGSSVAVKESENVSGLN